MNNRALPSCVTSFDRAVGIARVCAWCPDKAEGDKWATDQQMQVTHGICEACVAIQSDKQLDWMLKRIFP